MALICYTHRYLATSPPPLRASEDDLDRFDCAARTEANLSTAEYLAACGTVTAPAVIPRRARALPEHLTGGPRSMALHYARQRDLDEQLAASLAARTHLMREAAAASGDGRYRTAAAVLERSANSVSGNARLAGTAHLGLLEEAPM
ncbi:hypothetical protein [Streptomyces sp. NPDC059003]|uniref:hypothetical protein n=1 Tax=Streptomyces sp. NPDC059003 TaxID=3346691 RepID=UPI0036BD82A9